MFETLQSAPGLPKQHNIEDVTLIVVLVYIVYNGCIFAERFFVCVQNKRCHVGVKVILFFLGMDQRR